MSRTVEEALDLVVGAVARAFRVAPGEVAVDSDLFDRGGFVLRHRVLDSLELVEMVAAVEDAVGVDLEALLDPGGKLTLTEVARFVAGEVAVPAAEEM